MWCLVSHSRSLPPGLALVTCPGHDAIEVLVGAKSRQRSDACKVSRFSVCMLCAAQASNEIPVGQQRVFICLAQRPELAWSSTSWAFGFLVCEQFAGHLNAVGQVASVKNSRVTTKRVHPCGRGYRCGFLDLSPDTCVRAGGLDIAHACSHVPLPNTIWQSVRHG